MKIPQEIHLRVKPFFSFSYTVSHSLQIVNLYLFYVIINVSICIFSTFKLFDQDMMSTEVNISNLN